MLKFACRLLLLGITATPVLAAPLATTGSTLQVHFAPVDSSLQSGSGSDAFVDFGRVSAGSGAGRRGGIVVRKRIAVRLEGPAGAPATARLSAALTQETPGCTVRLDGVPLSTLPRLIDPVHRVGRAVVHEVEVTIPATVPAGMFASNLQWLVEND